VALETERLSMRPVEAADADAFAPYLADPEVVRFIGGQTLSRPEVDDRVALWRRRFDLDGFGHFALVRRADGVVVGRCGLLVWQLPGWEVTTRSEAVEPYELELGWMLGREHWGRGYATEAARAVVELTFGPLGRTRLISLIAEENVASAAVARRLGMAVEGEARLHDLRVEIWSLAAPASS
jgi:RimJ/RimL family protein N-acetyltransferase